VAAILALVIRVSILSGKRIGWKRWLLLATFGYIAFVGIQELKQVRIQGSEQELAIADQRYPVLWQPALPILRRFDLIEEVTDAEVLGPGQWISPAQYAQYALLDIVPRPLGSNKDSIGLIWGSQVRDRTWPGEPTTVYLAQGPIAEGYAFEGMGGIIFEECCLFLLTLLTARGLRSRHMVLGALAVYVIFVQPALFELGFLGGMESVGKGIQVAVLFYLAALLCMAAKKSEWDRLEFRDPVGWVRPDEGEVTTDDDPHHAREIVHRYRFPPRAAP
jgi:hypothetical protein